MPSYYDLGVHFETLRSIDSATFSGAFQAVGTPLANPCRLIKFVNNSNKDVIVSDDGINAKDIVPANSFALYDFTSNEIKDEGFFFPMGTQLYAKGSAGVGLFYITVIY